MSFGTWLGILNEMLIPPSRINGSHFSWEAAYLAGRQGMTGTDNSLTDLK
jgi:hypothetical protein